MRKSALATRFRAWKQERRSRRACREYEARVAAGLLSDRAHGLTRPLVVTLTSFAGRFQVLEKTLNCLIYQSVRPDRLVLWLAAQDYAKLPQTIL
ncbi:hypothetical protein FGG78_33355, partial [Thioclava sp. BHET1]